MLLCVLEMDKNWWQNKTYNNGSKKVSDSSLNGQNQEDQTKPCLLVQNVTLRPSLCLTFLFVCYLLLRCL